MRTIYHQDMDEFQLDADETDVNSNGAPLDVVFSADLPSSQSMADQSYAMRSDNHDRLILECDNFKMALGFESRTDLDRFVVQRVTTLADIATACVSREADEAILWIGNDPSGLWFIGVLQREKVWQGFAVHRRHFDAWHDGSFGCRQFTNFALEPNDQNASKVLNLLTDTKRGLGLPVAFPMLFVPFPSATSLFRMTVKLEPGTEWFLLVPIDCFGRQSAGGSLASLLEVEWIVTPKGLVRNAVQRRDMVRDLSDLKTVIEHTVVILNDYEHFDNDCLKATALVVELRNLMVRIDVQADGRIESLSLRSFLNPSGDEIERVLRDRTTWYVFGEFHVEDGRWQLGGQAGPFSLEWLGEKDLEHIKLLRIYHCNSVYDAHRPASPNDSITARLLRAGAMRVEGSTLPESHLTFLADLLGVLSTPSGLHEILFAKCLEQGKDLQPILMRLEELVGKSAAHRTV